MPRRRKISARRSPEPEPEAADPAALSRIALDAARGAGFVAAGVVAAGPPASWSRYRAWLDGGLHGEMGWLERDADPRRDLNSVLPGCRSVVCAALPVGDPTPGNVARYARAEDYHVVVKRLLGEVADELGARAPRGTRFRFRSCVDTAPLLERELAVRAGLGFLGKNGLLIVPGIGSHVVLGELLTDAALAPTARSLDASLDRCGECTRCLDACPTRAFTAPRVLDARRCLSYLTIEKRGPFTRAEAEAVAEAGTLFGCDVCQDVCPWNEPFFASAPAPEGEASLSPESLLDTDQASYEARFAGSAVWRATREGLERNARAVLRYE